MKRLLREPLLHFLFLGGILFAAHALLNRSPKVESSDLIVSGAQIEYLAARFMQFHQRAPAQDELKGLIDQYVREEVLAREALKLGLDRDDAVIRRRLQQKMEFIVTDFASIDEPTDTE